VRAATLALVGLCALTSVAAGQRKPTSCAPLDTSAEWYRRQREWLTESRSASGAAWTNDSLRAVLLAAAGIDPSRPLAVQLGGVSTDDTSAVATDAVDTALAQLRQLARDRQSPWPTRSVVGAAGVRATWRLVQRDTALQRTALHRMMEAGPEESLAAGVAVLDDRVRMQSGRKQLYGTQLRRVGATLVAGITEDSAHVDMRRDAAGLPPLRVALCAAAASTR
jgi:hypothetical protein